MKSYSKAQQLELDLEYARDNPNDLLFFQQMLNKYKNSEERVQKQLKALLMDRMLEFNPIFLMEKVAKENPHKTVYCNTQEDPFFRV